MARKESTASPESRQGPDQIGKSTSIDPNQIEHNKKQRAAKNRKREIIRYMKKNLRDALGYIECAEIDLFGAKILYNNEIYSLAIFHLQQAVEKTVKADYILSSYWKENITDIQNHISAPRVIDSLILSIEEAPHDIFERDFTIDFRKNFKEAYSKESKTLTQRTEAKIRKDFAFFDRECSKEILAIETEISEELSRSPSSEAKKILLLRKEEMIASCVIAAIIIPASLLTDWHESTTRYPDIRKENILTPLDYTPEMGLVKFAPEMIKMMWKALGLLRQKQSHLLNQLTLQL